MDKLETLDMSRIPTTVDVNKCLYTKLEKEEKDDRTLIVLQKESIFEIQLASGNRSKYLISDHSLQVKCGSGQRIYLKVANDQSIDQFFHDVSKSPGQQDVIIKIAKQQKIPLKKDTNFNSIKEQLLQLQKNKTNSLFYEITTPVPEEDIHSLTAADLEELTDLSLTDGVTKDARINYLYRGWIPIVNPVLLNSPSEIMPFNPHCILVTYTKVGKTTTGLKLGTVHDRPTPANLLGFSTATRGSNKEGALNNAVTLQTIDDISELREGEVSTKGFLNIMEQGEILISRGYGVHTKAYCPLLLTSNPLQDQQYNFTHSIDMDNAETIHLCEGIMNRIHDNPSAIGSRIGLLLFFPKMEPVDISTKVPYTIEEKLNKVLRTVQQMLANPFTRLLKNEVIREWLSLRDNQIKDYKRKINEILKNGRVKNISWVMHQLLDGQKANTSHLRGFPLRQAVMDHLHVLLHMENDDDFSDELLKSIIKKADERLKETFDVLIYPSLANIMNIFDGKVKDALHRLHYQNLARYPSYERVLLHVVADYALKDRDDCEVIVPLADLKDDFLNVVRDDRYRLWFNTFPKFLERIEKNQKSIVFHRGDLRFNLRSQDSVLCVVIPPADEWFTYVKQQPLKISSTNVDDSNAGISVTVLKSTPKAPKEPKREVETSPKTSKPPIRSKSVGEIGEMGAVSESVRKNSKKIQGVGGLGALAGFSEIKEEHVEWGKDLILNNPEFPLSAFISKIKNEWGDDLPKDEIVKVYRMVKRNIEKNKGGNKE